MKLRSATIQNFRCIENLSLEFDERLTVLVGANGAGKSAVLDAVTVAVGAWASQMSAVSFGIDQDDARNVCFSLGSGIDVQAQYPVVIHAQGNIDGHPVEWTRVRRSRKGRTALAEPGDFRSIAAGCIRRAAEGDTQLILPLVSYYGTGRLWAQKRHKRQNKPKLPKKSVRFDGYLDSLDAAANNKLMLEWFGKMTMRDLQSGHRSPEFLAVKNAIAKCFHNLDGGFVDEVRYDFDKADIEIAYQRENHHREVVALEQLSDGYKCAICLIADIAYRMAMLNPQLLGEVIELTEGIVLIDEVDLHLHPTWQRRVLRDLLAIFPKVQFIVSTHAPSVLHSIPIGKVVTLNNGSVQESVSLPYGRDVNSVLAEVMESKSRPDEVAKRFADFYACMDSRDFQRARQILDDLAADLGEYDPELTSCRVSLHLEQIQ